MMFLIIYSFSIKKTRVYIWSEIIGKKSIKRMKSIAKTRYIWLKGAKVCINAVHVVFPSWANLCSREHHVRLTSLVAYVGLRGMKGCTRHRRVERDKMETLKACPVNVMCENVCFFYETHDATGPLGATNNAWLRRPFQIKFFLFFIY